MNIDSQALKLITLYLCLVDVNRVLGTPTYMFEISVLLSLSRPFANDIFRKALGLSGGMHWFR